MNVLVVGGSGFLGRHLLRRLANEDVRVRVYGRRRLSFPGVEDLYGDVSDRRRLREALEGVECVFHLAWTTVPVTSNEDPQSDLMANVVAGLGLLDACRETGVATVVFPSSGGTVYGVVPARRPIDEDEQTEPISSYGVSKLTFEKYLALYKHLYGLDYRVLRISNAYGEGQQGNRPQGLIGVALQQIATARPITVWGDGSATRDYIYAADAVDCCVTAALTTLAPEAPRVFNVGSGRPLTVREVLDVIADATGRTLDVTFTPPRGFDVEYSVLSTGRARRTLGWTPAVPIEDGIARTWEWVRTGQDRGTGWDDFTHG